MLCITCMKETLHYCCNRLPPEGRHLSLIIIQEVNSKSCFTFNIQYTDSWALCSNPMTWVSSFSFPQLYDLMTMAFKYQVLLCPRPKDILLVSFNHMDAIKDFLKDTPSILSQVDETYQQLIEARPIHWNFTEINYKLTLYNDYRLCINTQLIHRLHVSCFFLPFQMYTPLSGGDFQLIRQTLLIFFQDMHIRVSPRSLIWTQRGQDIW